MDIFAFTTIKLSVRGVNESKLSFTYGIQVYNILIEKQHQAEKEFIQNKTHEISEKPLFFFFLSILCTFLTISRKLFFSRHLEGY